MDDAQEFKDVDITELETAEGTRALLKRGVHFEPLSTRPAASSQWTAQQWGDRQSWPDDSRSTHKQDDRWHHDDYRGSSWTNRRSSGWLRSRSQRPTV